MAVHASIVPVASMTNIGSSALVEMANTCGHTEDVPSNTTSTLRSDEWGPSREGYEVTYDTPVGTWDLGEDIVGDTGGGRARIIGVDTPNLKLILGDLEEGTLWVNNEGLTGQESGATGDVNVTVTRTKTYYGALARLATDQVWVIENTETYPIYVAFGADPDPTAVYATADTTARRLVKAGATRFFGVSNFGEFFKWVAA